MKYRIQRRADSWTLTLPNGLVLRYGSFQECMTTFNTCLRERWVFFK